MPPRILAKVIYQRPLTRRSSHAQLLAECTSQMRTFLTRIPARATRLQPGIYGAKILEPIPGFLLPTSFCFGLGVLSLCACAGRPVWQTILSSCYVECLLCPKVSTFTAFVYVDTARPFRKPEDARALAVTTTFHIYFSPTT